MRTERAQQDYTARTVRGGGGELGQRAAGWNKGLPLRLHREVGQRLDGKAPEANERKAVTNMEKGDSLRHIQACSDP